MRRLQMAALAAMILTGAVGWSNDAAIARAMPKAKSKALPLKQMSSVIRPAQMNILGKTVQGSEVRPDHRVSKIEGQPLTAVVVTQCNLIEAVYLTMPDGKLVRFSASQLRKIPAGDLVGFVYTRAKVSERIETDCRGAAGQPQFEKHSDNAI